MENKLIKIAILAMFITVVIITTVTSASAQDDRMPNIEGQMKSLKIEFYIEKSGIKSPIQGAKISIYRVSDIQIQGGSAEYIVLGKYSQLKKLDDGRDVTFNGITVSQSQELAQQFAQVVSNPDFTAVTDVQGECNFSNLLQGMYLIKEEAATLEAEKYEKIAPYLISVPLAEKTDDGNHWIYSVMSAPKTKVSEIPTEQPSERATQIPTAQKSTLSSKSKNYQTKATAGNVKTGKSLMILLPLLIIWFLIFTLVKAREKKVKNNDRT